MNVSKMGDLHCTLTLDTDPVERKLKIIGKHLTAMADELELAKQLEDMDFKVHSACEPTSADTARSRCNHCGKVLEGPCCAVRPDSQELFCSAHCADHAEFRAWLDRLHDIGIWAAQRPDEIRSTPEQSEIVLVGDTHIGPEFITTLTDAVVKRLRDFFGLEV